MSRQPGALIFYHLGMIAITLFLGLRGMAQQELSLVEEPASQELQPTSVAQPGPAPLKYRGFALSGKQSD